jgi:hypothetical protein
MEKGMILKDATHLNIQFINNRPYLIDHLSFELYQEGSSWIAYRQFCECFLNPLLLGAYCKAEVHNLLTAYPDGIPASLTAKLLPFRSRLNTAILLHVFLPAKINKNKQSNQPSNNQSLSKEKILRILDHLTGCIQKLKSTNSFSVWDNYYEETILSPAYLDTKKTMVAELLAGQHFASVLDLGANEGGFSRLCKESSLVVAADGDSSCINQLYNALKKDKNTNILPLVLDIMHPTANTGWENKEQTAFFQRQKFDLCMALALVHHLCIAKNVTLLQLAGFFSNLCQTLIIEFVPKDDPKVKLLLNNREDIFDQYNQTHFEESFSSFFTIQSCTNIPHSNRVLYLLTKK